MGFVPLQGPATLHAGTVPRESEIEFTGRRRAIRIPIKGAIPILSRALQEDDAHDSVTLLGAATLLTMRLVAAGRVHRADDAWRVGPLGADDRDRIRDLAVARAYDGITPAEAESMIIGLADAIADTVTRQPAGPTPPPSRPVGSSPDGSTSVAGATHAPGATRRRLVRHQLRRRLEGEDRAVDDVDLRLRVDAPEELLCAGTVALVPQLHESGGSGRIADLALVLDGDAPDFGLRARSRGLTLLRRAVKAWPTLGRHLDATGAVPYRIVMEADDLGDLVEHGTAALDAVGIDVLWPRALVADLAPQARVEKVTTAGPATRPGAGGVFGPEALFAFDWRLALADEPLNDEEMAELAGALTPIVRLRDQWRVVDPALLRRARRRAGTRTIEPVEALRATLTGSIDLDGEEVAVHPGATLEQVRERIADAASVAPLAAPTSLAATLRHYQRAGFTWLAELTGAGLGACLADDMGLGKTITLISLHLHRRERGLATGPTLVVCPASLLGNWEQEIRRFAPGVPVRRYHADRRDLAGLVDREEPADAGPIDLRIPGPTSPDPALFAITAPGPDDAAETAGDRGFVLTTYQTMRRHVDDLGRVSWDLVVADEAQHIKNPRSAVARAIRQIGSSGRIALTGTPVENDLTELWAILDWIVPGLLGSRQAFRKRWAAPIEAGVDPALTREFARLVDPFLLRRRKSDPGIAPELPRKTETDRLVGLTTEQTGLYQTLVQESMHRIEQAEPETRRGLVLALLTGLKQICNHPAQYLHQPHGRLTSRSTKLEVLDELLDTIIAEGGTALVFTQYVAMARLIERHLTERGIDSLLLHGGTPVRRREEMVAEFQDGAVPVFLLSLKAGGTGLNLTRADHVVHFDRWWNPAVEDQATDRAYRIGQTRAVQVHRLVTEGTVEEKVAELLERKRSLAEAVLGSGEQALTELDDAELRELVMLQPR